MLNNLYPTVPSRRPTMKNIIRAGITAAVLSLGLTGPSAAATLEDGLAAYERGGYAPAIPLFRAFADQGNADAQLHLGFMYEDGRGVPQDNAIAASWYQKAADQGNVEAQFHLRSMYEDGRGVPQDNAIAVTWYQKAADQGVALAQEILGDMYERGLGVPQDYVAAHIWYNLVAHYIPGLLDEHALTLRDEVAAKMTPEQIAEAERRRRRGRHGSCHGSTTKAPQDGAPTPTAGSTGAEPRHRRQERHVAKKRDAMKEHD
jgi:hypothetical protein